MFLSSDLDWSRIIILIFHINKFFLDWSRSDFLNYTAEPQTPNAQLCLWSPSGQLSLANFETNFYYV